MGTAKKNYEDHKDDYEKYKQFLQQKIEYKERKEKELAELAKKVSNLKNAKEDALMKVENIRMDVRSKGVMGGAADGAQLEARATSLLQSINSIRDHIQTLEKSRWDKEVKFSRAKENFDGLVRKYNSELISLGLEQDEESFFKYDEHRC